MSRVDQLNSLLAQELARLVEREIFLDNGLITITSVDCSADLKHAKVGFSVLPASLTGTALALLKKNSRLFRDQLKKKLTLKFIPRFFWEVDGRPQRASEIEETLKELGF
ncbi:MAG: ribosome-binding factor A [Planctomycetes bacterium]|jgi:ribosome-binding factor A|nr:ribosome-binding factor A [Planctomycetota bacterium]